MKKIRNYRIDGKRLTERVQSRREKRGRKIVCVFVCVCLCLCLCVRKMWEWIKEEGREGNGRRVKDEGREGNGRRERWRNRVTTIQTV